ncbi:MAG TPA: HPr family phosphocarrier protein, partial [Chloroflexaceae bacterium]|nr:HPr family phosphocarrier protein [Chloroflexaceae bacterium]
MQQLDLVITNSTGLHARPARVFVDVARQFQATIHVQHGAKRVNAKSLISVLTLGVAHGQRIQIDVSGDDEEQAASALALAVRGGLGEPLGEAGHAAPAADLTPQPPLRRGEGEPRSGGVRSATAPWSCAACRAPLAWSSARSSASSGPGSRCARASPAPSPSRP